MRRFVLIWLAELVSLVGSALTGFVLGVWVFQRTGSATEFALTMLCATLPGILAAPVAGVVADRYDRRRVLVAADSFAALATALVALMIWLDALAVWQVYLAAVVGSVCATVHLITYQALTPLLIPERHLGRANGLMQAAWAAQIAAPLIAGALLVAVGLGGVLLLDLASFAVAVSAVLLIRLPASATRPSGDTRPPPLRQDLLYGFAHLRASPALLALVAVFAGHNLLFGVAGVLVQPLILSFSSPATLGALMFAGGAGLFAGSLVMGVWGGPKRKMTGIALFTLLGGLALIAHTPSPSALLIAVAAPAFLFTLPVVHGCVMALLQARTEPESLGRVMAAARVAGQSMMPVAYLSAAPIAEWLDGSALALSGLVGAGPGRGIALVLLVAGLLMVALAAVTHFHPRLRTETETETETEHDARSLR